MVGEPHGTTFGENTDLWHVYIHNDLFINENKIYIIMEKNITFIMPFFCLEPL